MVAALANLRASHPRVTIDHIGRAGLWDIVKELPLPDRQALLGPVPALSVATTITAAEIQVLMTYLGRQMSVANDTAGFDLTAIAGKIAAKPAIGGRYEYGDAFRARGKPGPQVRSRECLTQAHSHGIALKLAEEYTKLRRICWRS